MRDQLRPARRLVNLLACVLLLAAGGAAFVGSLSASPAINENLRAKGPYGDWRHVPSEAFYDAGEYYFEMGYGYVMALFRDFLAETKGEPTLFGDRAAMLQKARDLLQRALERSPADAQAWASLALVAIMQGDEHLRMNALRRSWELAPFSLPIAPLRLMALSVATPVDPGPEIQEAIQRDLRVIRRTTRGGVEQLRKASPQLDALIGNLEGA